MQWLKRKLVSLCLVLAFLSLWWGAPGVLVALFDWDLKAAATGAAILSHVVPKHYGGEIPLSAVALWQQVVVFFKTMGSWFPPPYGDRTQAALRGLAIEGWLLFSISRLLLRILGALLRAKPAQPRPPNPVLQRVTAAHSPQKTRR